MEFHKFEERIVAEKHNVFFGKIKTKLFAEKIDAVDEYGVSNREIEIFYMVRRSLVEEAPYLIFFNGGPGIGFSEQFFEHNGYNDFMTDYNIVFMDQRGTGFSDRPLNNLYEYRYFSSRYICHDAEEIRKKLLTGNKKWIVFGQSFGGHLVRKYLELYANSALVGISHGYGECSSITMKRNIEKVLFKQVDDYFLKYPKDKSTFLNIKENLNEKDVIGNDIRCLEGKNIMDIFSFYFGLYKYDKIHEIIEKINSSENSKGEFLEEIKYLGNLILNSGILNAVVAYIDLVDGLTDDEIYYKTEEKLLDEGIILEEKMFSTVRLSKNIISKDKNIIELEEIFKSKKFNVDPINFQLLCDRLNENKVILYVIGSKNDSLTPIEAIEEEKRTVENYNIKDHYKFVFSDGNHREWKDNQEIIYSCLV